METWIYSCFYWRLGHKSGKKNSNTKIVKAFGFLFSCPSTADMLHNYTPTATWYHKPIEYVNEIRTCTGFTVWVCFSPIWGQGMEGKQVKTASTPGCSLFYFYFFTPLSGYEGFLVEPNKPSACLYSFRTGVSNSIYWKMYGSCPCLPFSPDM